MQYTGTLIADLITLVETVQGRRDVPLRWPRSVLRSPAAMNVAKGRQRNEVDTFGASAADQPTAHLWADLWQAQVVS